MHKKLWLTVLMLPFLGACGTTVVDTVHPVVRTAAIGEGKKIVILPFADHTPGDSPYVYWQRNVLINEAVQDDILRYGYVPAPQEDVIDYLFKKNIIQNVNSSKKVFGTDALLEDELSKDGRSDAMKMEIMRMLHNNTMRAEGNNKSEKYWNGEKLITLDHGRIKKLGAEFGADYVIRGRIITFRQGQTDSFDPTKTGILPFFFKVGSRVVFGVTQSDSYEMVDKRVIGGLSGAAVTSNKWEGATVGSGLAVLSHKGGRDDMAAVQLRMLIQDTHTGEIIWTNRVEVEVSPTSTFGEQDKNKLIAQAIQQASTRLIDDFMARK
ncbi:MAG: hypothetical protein NT087_10185 [Deltaproteobacteria bacterium]|nr:hypothetical protein [Deltaproteobacteria bacterium]